MFKRNVRRAIDDLFKLRSQLDLVDERLNRDLANGFPPRSGENIGRGSGKKDPTAQVALNGKDEIEASKDRLEEFIYQAQKFARFALNEANAIVGLEPEEAKRIINGQLARVSQCLNCDVVVTGVGEDRVRAGRCPACYKHYQRHSGQDRKIRLYGSMAAEVTR